MNSGPLPDGGKGEIPVAGCSRCGGRGRIKDRRPVLQRVPDGAGGAMRVVVFRTRMTCCRRSWTIREPGGYPRRSCTLALAVAVVETLEKVPSESLSSVARRFKCHRRTVARLLMWAESIDTVESVAGKCFQVDPATELPAAPQLLDPPRPRRPGCALKGLARAGHLVLLLDHLAGLLRGHGVGLEEGPGLVVLLREQFRRWGEISHVTRAPPPLRIPWSPGTSAS